MNVCITMPSSGTLKNQWEFVLDNFAPTELYVIGQMEGNEKNKIFKNATYVESASDLPNKKLVVLAPEEGRYIKGATSLLDHKYTEDAIYLFGPDNYHLSEDQMGSRVADETVYIPTDSVHEMYSFVCYAVVLWDKRLRRG